MIPDPLQLWQPRVCLGSSKGVVKGTQGLPDGTLGSTARASVAEFFSKRLSSPHSALYAGGQF